jgi:hypothetical protein
MDREERRREAIQSGQRELKYFAEPVTGRDRATRWLAMTGR